MSSQSSPKTILFLCRRDDRQHYDTAASMARVMQTIDAKLSYEAADLEDLLFIYDGQDLKVLHTNTGKDLRTYDGIFLLGWFKTKILEDVALAVSRYAAAADVPIMNSEAMGTRSRSKLSQYVVAALDGIAITPFVFSIDNHHLQKHAASYIDFPFIMKSVQASRGADNHLIASEDELGKVLTESDESIPFVVQTFIPNDGDYRLLVMGDSVRVALHRRSQSDSHINNTSQGGLATEVPLHELNQHMLDDAVRIATLLKREVTGVDMIIHRETGRYFMLEANNMPQLSTGSLVKSKMAALDAFFTEWLGADKR